MHRLRGIRRPPISNCVQMSSRPKRENHYDTLKVKTAATQNEIKAAYYEQSKKYHPDVNQSQDAKDQFRKISEAYEVLGSHESRRNYDRIMSIRGAPLGSNDRGFTYRKTATTNDPRMKAYRKEAESYGTGATSQHTFNYDAWARAHYGASLDRSMKLKSKQQDLDERTRRAVEFDEELIRKVESKFSGPFVLFIFVVSLFGMSLMNFRSYDEANARGKLKPEEAKGER